MRHAMVHHHPLDCPFCCSSRSDGLESPIFNPSWQIWICHNLLTKSILWAEFLLWQGCGLFLRVSSTILAMVDCRHCWYACRRVRPAFDFEYVLFMEWGGALPKMRHLRTSPKLHMVRTARATHQNNQIAHDPNQKTWRTLNTYVFPRTLCLEIKSTYKHTFYYFTRIKWFRQCCCKKLENKTAQ